MHYKVSVVIPVYNAREQLGRCVESLMKQTLREIEYIFVEDGSTDGSYELLLDSLSRYPERRDDVKIIRHTENRGIPATRNDGNGAATGDFIIHCDSDDWTDVTMYEKMYDKAIKDKAEICICDFYLAGTDGLFRASPEIDCTKSHEKAVYDYIVWVWNTLWNVLVSRDVYARCDTRLPEDISFTEDFYLTVRLFQCAGKITALHEALYYYNQSNVTSIVHSIGFSAMNQELQCYERTIAWMKERDIEQLYHRPMQWRLIKASCSLVTNNRFEEFRTIHPESHRYILTVPKAYFTTKVKLMLLLAVLKLDFICRWDNHRHGRCE